MFFNIKGYSTDGTNREVIFSLKDGVTYKDNTNTVHISSQDVEVDMEQLQVGLDLYDNNGLEVFLGDCVHVNGELAFVDYVPDQGVALRSIKRKKNIISHNVSDSVKVSGPFLFNTLDKVNELFKYPRYEYYGKLFDLRELEYNDGILVNYKNGTSEKVAQSKINQKVGVQSFAGGTFKAKGV